MKHAPCPDCGGTGIVPACTECLKPSIGICCICKKHGCDDHAGDLYGVALCYRCKLQATVADVDRAAKVSA